MRALWNDVLQHKKLWIVSTLVLVGIIVVIVLLLRQDEHSTFFYDAY